MTFNIFMRKMNSKLPRNRPINALYLVIVSYLDKALRFLYVPQGFNIKKILHGARLALSVLCGSQNRQRLLLYISLTLILLTWTIWRAPSNVSNCGWDLIQRLKG